MNQPNYTKLIATKLNLQETQVTNTLSLIDDLNTVPFIARYRKEATQNLDETQIRAIVTLRTKETKLYESKLSALKAIEEQKKLTSELKKNIESSKTLAEVEDYYAPYKKKKETKADIAIKKGFKPIADLIQEEATLKAIETLIKKQFSKLKSELVLNGAKDIVVQEINDNVKVKNNLRKIISKDGIIKSVYAKKIEELPEKISSQKHKFEIYKEFSNNNKRLKSYQILALNRGEDLKLLKVGLYKEDKLQEQYTKLFKLKQEESTLTDCIKDAYKKQFKSVETELRNTLTEKAQLESIELFKDNLKKLLLIKPNYNNVVLAIDPGFRTGCKIAILDKETKALKFEKINILDKKDKAQKTIQKLEKKYKPDVIVLGNGTASNETYDFLKTFTETKIVVVNESGASVYSASKIANEEFPKLDATERGTISIGRRYIDPLAELVKIPTQSIGVGMYQHDVNQKLLTTELGFVVEDVVNMVGINLNTTTEHVLSLISGLNKKLAKKIIENKPYTSRQDLEKVLTKKAYTQAAGFLRVKDSKEEFDDTNIHPEQYELAKYLIKNNITANNFILPLIQKDYPDITEQTIKDINEAIENKDKDHRVYDGNLKIDSTITMDDLEVDQVLKGIVRNIMPFGVFVDIGVKNNGLIHISELADQFVKYPGEHVTIGEIVDVKIISLEKETGKIGLSKKF